MEEKRFNNTRRKLKTAIEKAINGIIDLLTAEELIELQQYIEELYEKKSFVFLEPLRLQKILKEDQELLKMLAYDPHR